jgi:hypothetical protein
MDVEWLILADAAQVVSGKLYLLGGGWDVLTVNAPFPVQQKLTIAAAFRVPWNETNQPHPFQIEIVDEDGHALLTGGGQVEVGRPPGLPFGTEQRSQLALDAVVTFQRPGTYVAVARVGEQERRTTFRVVPGPAAPGPPLAAP